MTKAELRNDIRKKNRMIGISERTEEALNIFNTIELEPVFTRSKTIAIYLSLPDEPATHNIVERWYAMGKHIVIPRVNGETIDFIEYKPRAIDLGAFGIMEPTNNTIIPPSKIELMILPGVAFCSDGRRLGRGRGYYDRYLAQSDFRAYTIGVGFAHQLVDDIECEAHDIKLSKIITPIIKSGTPSLPEVIVKVIDSAGAAAVKLGCGVDSLLERGLTWVLSKFAIEIYEIPSSIEDLHIETWIDACNRIASTRNFALLDKCGRRIGVATSQWCIIDMKIRRPIDLTTTKFDYVRHVAPREIMIERPRKIPTINGDDILITHHTATELDIDFNNHVNTMRYIEMMMTMVDGEKRKNYAHIRVDIHFMNESILGDNLTIKEKKQPLPNGSQLLFEIMRPDGSTSVRALFNYKN